MSKEAATWIAVASFGLWLSACGQAPDGRHQYEPSADDEVVSGPLMGKTTAYWTGSPPIVSVCWENASSTGTVTGTGFTVSESTARSWAQQAIEQSWQRYARVNFTGWGSCSSSSQVRIHIDSDTTNNAPVTLGGLGKEISKKSPGVRLSLYFNDESSRCKPNVTTYHNCVISDIMHEFGHVLGFYHEEERADYTGPTCGGTPNGKQSGTKYGVYDQRSIMSYCSDGVNGTRAFQSLSPDDIASVQRAYGRRIPGQFVSDHGYCLAANNFNPGNPGPRAFLWTCDEFADDQEWAWSPTSHSISASLSSAPGNPACITNGNVTVNDCNQSLGQTFRATDTEIRGWGGLCMDLTAGNQTNGTPIQSWDCLKNSNQLWNISDAGEIKLAVNTNKCITVNGGGTANGTALVISTCTGSSSQKFRFSNDHIYFSTGGVSSKCVDSPAVLDSQFVLGNGLPSNGSVAQIWDCLSAQRNQLWNLTGSFTNALGGCIDRGSSDGDSTFMTTTTCNDSVGQTWDYYFK